VFISNAYAQAAPAAGGGDLFTSIMPLLLMFAVMYFLMIRPQMKKSKEHKAMLEAVQKGDEIITAGGMLGKVSKVSDSYISLEIAEVNGQAVELNVQKSAVQVLLPKGTIKSI
jgi:preprotein translocase subunit YajC